MDAFGKGGSSMNQAPGTDDLKKAVDNPTTGLLSSSDHLYVV